MLDSKFRILIKSFLWNAGGNLISKGSIFLTSILASRFLGMEDYGRLGIIQQTIAVLAGFAVLGLSVTAVKFVSENKSKGKNAIRELINIITIVSVVLSLIVSCFMYIFSEYISVSFFNAQDITELMQLASIALFFNATNQIQFGVLSGLGKFKLNSVSYLCSAIVGIPLTIILMIKFNVVGIIYALIISSLITVLINRYFINCSINELNDIPYNGSWNILKIFGFALPNVLAALSFSLSGWYTFSLISNSTNGLAEIAVFNATNNLFGIIYLFPVMLAQVLMSMSSASKLDGLELLKKSIKSVAITVIPITFVAIIFSGEILSIYGDGYESFSSVLSVSMLTVIIVSLSSQVEHYIVARGLVWKYFIANVIFSLSIIIISVWVMNYGVLGIVTARLCSFAFKSAFVTYILVKYVKREETVHC